MDTFLVTSMHHTLIYNDLGLTYVNIYDICILLSTLKHLSDSTQIEVASRNQVQIICW